MLRIIDQILILALAIDAGWVAAGIIRRRIMWRWICLYWVILTSRNIVAFIA